jgi:hypothetical protein
MENYRGFLLALKKKWDDKSGNIEGFEVGRIHTDYEKAEMIAVQEVFGKEKLRGCLFHYVKALLLYLRKNCPLIFQLYTQEKNEKGEFWKLVINILKNVFIFFEQIRKILALPLLPKAIVHIFWKILKNCSFEIEGNLLVEWNVFIKYVEHEWLEKKDNVWDFNMLGRVRGTNPAEAYHSALKRRVFNIYFLNINLLKELV